MKKILLVCTGIFSVIFLHAQVAGPNSGGTFGTTALVGSTASWVNPGNVATNDNTYATFGNIPNPSGNHTDYLVVSNFGFAIPAGATVNGIFVEIERSDSNFRTSDFSIRLMQGGVISSLDRSAGALYPLTDSYQGYGSASDLWGLAWTAADINSSGFGVAIAAQRNTSGGATAGRINHVRITVFYNFILPVRLISFTAQKAGGSIHLSWVTTGEKQMARYEVERSSDGRHFTSIGTVSSLNVYSGFTYTFDDKTPLAGTSYYRLKLIGIDGDINYSRTISLKSGWSSAPAKLYPNPYQAGGNLTIDNSASEQLIIQFFNLGGQRVAVVNTSSNLVPSQQLSTQQGMLLYKVMTRDGTVLGTGKLIIQ